MRRSFPPSVFLAILSAAWLTVGCGSGGSFNCTGSYEPALDVFVLDARTNAPAAEGAIVTVRDGNYTETLRTYRFYRPEPPDTVEVALSFAGAFERPGTYTVRVEKAGYEPWEIRNVRVREDECHVITRRLEANLTPRD